MTRVTSCIGDSSADTSWQVADADESARSASVHGLTVRQPSVSLGFAVVGRRPPRWRRIAGLGREVGASQSLTGRCRRRNPLFMRTFVASAKSADSRWHVIDAKGQVLGRVATLAAKLLQGKHKAIYTPFIDTGDHVVIVNAGDGQADRPQGRAEALSPAQRLRRRPARRARRSTCASASRSVWWKKRCAACCRRPRWATRCTAS